MRFLLGVFALALSATASSACASGEATKDTLVTSSDSATTLARSAPATASSPEGAAGASATAPGAVPNVLVIGTSLTAGLGLDPNDAYPAVIQRMADSAGYRVRVVNAGLSGETSAGALRRLDWLLREQAAMVVVETGANDGLRGLNPDSTRENLAAIVRRLKSAYPGAPIVLVQMEAPPNLGVRYTQRFHAMFGEVAESEGATLAPFLLEGVAGVSRYNQADGIHPTRQGARMAARTIWPTLEPLIRALSPVS